MTDIYREITDGKQFPDDSGGGGSRLKFNGNNISGITHIRLPHNKSTYGYVSFAIQPSR